MVSFFFLLMHEFIFLRVREFEAKLIWDESVKRDFKDWDISDELALDRSAWRLNVPEP